MNVTDRIMIYNKFTTETGCGTGDKVNLTAFEFK